MTMLHRWANATACSGCTGLSRLAQGWGMVLSKVLLRVVFKLGVLLPEAKPATSCLLQVLHPMST